MHAENFRLKSKKETDQMLTGGSNFKEEEEEFYVPERYPFCTNLRQNYFFQRPSCHHVFFFFHLVIELTETGIHQPTLNPQTIITDFLSRTLFCRQILHHLRITAALINESPSLALVPTAHQTLKSWSFCARQRDAPKGIFCLHIGV